MAAKSNTYVIGCKLPNGLTIHAGDVKVTLAGANSSALINGFGITKDVSADVWDVFAKNHKDSKFIKNGLIFAVGDMESAQDASLDQAKQKTGLEQASQKTDGVEPDKEE